MTIRTLALRGNPLGHASSVKINTSIEYINKIVKQTCAILADWIVNNQFNGRIL